MACLDELLVAEGSSLVSNESPECSAMPVLEGSLRIDLSSLCASPEELGPLVLHTERVKVGIDLVLRNTREVGHHVRPLESFCHSLAILKKLIVNLGCVLGTLWDVAVEERNLVEVTELCQLHLEVV